MAWLRHYLLSCSKLDAGWLGAMAGGPNARAAIQLLPSLVKLGQASQIRLCQVFEPSNSEPDTTALEQASRELSRRHLSSSTVSIAPIKANSVSEGVINFVKSNHFDVIVLGASREGLLQQAIKGNIPAASPHGQAPLGHRSWM